MTLQVNNLTSGYNYGNASGSSFTGYQYSAPITRDQLEGFQLSRTTGIPAGTKIAIFGLRK